MTIPRAVSLQTRAIGLEIFYRTNFQNIEEFPCEMNL